MDEEKSNVHTQRSHGLASPIRLEFYLLKPYNPVAWRSYVKGFDAGAATWFGYYGDGFKKTWLDK